QTGYDDSNPSTWKTGPGPFDGKRGTNGLAGPDCRDEMQFALGPVGTCLRLTNSAGTTNITFNFRTHFSFPSTPTATTMLKLRGKIDDGAIIYLNGTELERLRFPAAPA